MKKTSILFYLVGLIFIVGCVKDKDSDEKKEVESNLPIFSGYTATDFQGVPMGDYDSTDWRLDDVWQDVEKQLFEDYESYGNNCPIDSNIDFYPAYPNPTNDLFWIYRAEDSSTRFRVRVVNQQFDVLASQDSIYGDYYGCNIGELVNSNDRMVRVYYMFVKDDNCILKGHGDIKLN